MLGTVSQAFAYEADPATPAVGGVVMAYEVQTRAVLGMTGSTTGGPTGDFGDFGGD